MSSRIGEAIQSSIAAVFDDFIRVDAEPGFRYRRHTPPLFSFIVIQHSSKYRCFEVDVVSTVFPTWDRQYGTHQLWRATGLANLRSGSNSMLMEDVPYNYIDDPNEALIRITHELREFSVPWFNSPGQELATDGLVQFGSALMKEYAGFTPDLDYLKQQLRKEADRVAATKWQRRETATLAIDLLRWDQEKEG